LQSEAARSDVGYLIIDEFKSTRIFAQRKTARLRRSVCSWFPKPGVFTDDEDQLQRKRRRNWSSVVCCNKHTGIYRIVNILNFVVTLFHFDFYVFV